MGYVFVNERNQPFGRMGIGRMIERAGEAAKLPFPVHVHMLRHSTGYALAERGMDTRRFVPIGYIDPLASFMRMSAPSTFE